METEIWSTIFILLICVRRSFVFGQIQQTVISSDDNVRTITTESTALSTTDQSYR
jgi:hypothetical protein